MGRPRVYDDALRTRLIDRAAAVVAARGADALSLRALAEESGTSTNAVYAIFGGKEALLSEVFRSAVSGLAEAQRALPRTDDPMQDLLVSGLGYRDWALDNESLYLVMLRRGENPDSDSSIIDALADEGLAPLRDAVRRLVANGVFLPRDPQRIALSIWMSVHGFVSLEISRQMPRSEGDALYREHLDAIMRGWAAGPASSQTASGRDRAPGSTR